MKNKQLKEYLGKRVTFRTVWDTFDTANFIELVGGHAIFKNDNGEIHIKIFNIAQIQLYDKDITFGNTQDIESEVAVNNATIVNIKTLEEI